MRLRPSSQGCPSVQSTPPVKRCTACRLLRAVPEAQKNTIQPLIPTLQTVEVAAITVAAGTQAVLLLQPALAALQRAPQQISRQQHEQAAAGQYNDPLSGSQAAATATTISGPSSVSPTPATAAAEMVIDQMPVHLSATPATAAAGFNSMGHAALQQLQACAILVALMAGAALRHLSSVTRAMAAHQHKQQLSAEGAARLVALEAAAAAQAGDMAASSKQLAKLSARVQVATSDLKVPLRQLQQAAGQQAAALAALAEVQGALDSRLGGVEQVLGALQEVQAKQFKVTAQVLQQAQQQKQQQGAARSRASSPGELASLQRQQQQLEAAVKAQQQHLLKLEVLLQQARAATSSQGLPAVDSATTPTTSSSGSSSSSAGVTSVDSASNTAADGSAHNGSSSNSSSSGVVPPDPWQRPLPMPPAGLAVPDAGPVMRRR